MLPRTYDQERCSIARALERLGERWTLLVLREAFSGRRRFDEFAEALDIARNVLATRLALLVEEGILAKRRYSERPVRYEYRLTRKGLDLWPVLVTLMQWGDRWYAPYGPPRVLRHRDCGGGVDRHLTCDRCGKPLEPRDVVAEPGPGAEHPPAAAA
jgi:DNA-binding HxlR family transcriptional regulator